MRKARRKGGSLAGSGCIRDARARLWAAPPLRWSSSCWKDGYALEFWDCLIVDDEQVLTEAAAEYCNLMGIRTKGVVSAAECEEFLAHNHPRLIVLDINLGDMNGFKLCRSLRETTDVPILFLSARSSDDDKIAAYALGGDDYIQKPCSLSVLAAKIKAVLKRCTGGSGGYDDGYLRINPALHEVHVKGHPCKLTPLEYRLLVCLAAHSGHVVSKQQIFDEVWKDSITADGTLNVHIRRLREQVEPDPSRPSYIVTVHGEGYRFAGQGSC